jgi:hypothetical protein
VVGEPRARFKGANQMSKLSEMSRIFAGDMSFRMRRAVLAAGAVLLAAGAVAAQPAPKPSMPAEVDGSKQGADKAMVVKPPASKNTICLWYDGTRPGCRAVLREDLSGQRRRRRPSRAGRLPLGQAGRRPHGRIHGHGHSLPRPERRPGCSSTAKPSRSRWRPTTRPKPIACGTRSSATAARRAQCGWCKDKWGLSWQITPRALTGGDHRPGPRGGQARLRSHDGDGKIDIARIEAARRG